MKSWTGKGLIRKGTSNVQENYWRHFFGGRANSEGECSRPAKFFQNFNKFDYQESTLYVRMQDSEYKKVIYGRAKKC